MPTHYSFKVVSKLDELARRYEDLSRCSPQELDERRAQRRKPAITAPPEKQVRAVIAALDARGAWVEEGRLRYHGEADETRTVIDSATFIRNVGILSRCLAQLPSAERRSSGTSTKRFLGPWKASGSGVRISKWAVDRRRPAAADPPPILKFERPTPVRSHRGVIIGTQSRPISVWCQVASEMRTRWRGQVLQSSNVPAKAFSTWRIPGAGIVELQTT